MVNLDSKKSWLDFIGVIFLVWGISSYIYQLSFGDLSSIFWLSYIGLIITGIGILKRNSFLIASQIAIYAIPYIIWSVDFLYFLFIGEPLFGITDYIFSGRSFLENLLSLQHLFNIPLALLSLYLIKLKNNKFWIFSIGQISLFYFLSLFITPAEKNINCVFENCIDLFYFQPYFLSWFLGYFIMIGLTSFVIWKVKVFRKL